MKPRRRSNIVLGLLLLVIGGWLLAQRILPLRFLADFSFSWPWWVIGTGVFLLLLGLLLGEPGLAIPATIVGGIGALLFWQNATGNWESWAYAWTLIPGFVGLGIFLAGLLEGNFLHSIRSGGVLVVISAVLFVIFASLFGKSHFLGPYWPVLLILLGAWMLLRIFWGYRSKRSE